MASRSATMALSGALQARLSEGLSCDATGRLKLRMQLRERRHIGVALDHGRDRTETTHGRGIQRPHRIGHGMIVSIDEIVAVVLMPGEVYLLHALARNGMQVAVGIKFVIDAAHEDIVDVEQNEAIGLLRHRLEELPLREARVAKADIA